MAKEKVERSFLKLAEAFQVKEKLDDVLIKHDDGTCTYIGVDTDETIAAVMPFKCTVSNVRGVREQFFGHIARQAGSKTKEIVTRLEAAERDLADLRKLYHNLSKHVEHVERPGMD